MIDNIRTKTIKEIKEMIKSNWSFEQILKAKWLYFARARIREYYRIALEEIESETDKK